MAYTAKERQSIALRAKRKLGLMHKQSAADKYLFMSACIDQLTTEGEDDGRARDICEVLWSEGSDLDEFD